MKLLTRAQALGKKLTLISTAFILAVSTLTASLPFILSQRAGAVGSVQVTSLNGWYDDSKANGHSEMVEGGLHVWTTGGSTDGSTRKAAKYLSVAPFPLSQAADASIAFAPGATGPLPSLQLGVDMDNDPTTWDGYLVYEPSAYGEGQFWTNRDFGISGGQGYTNLGTIAEYFAANQNAKVTAIGYSLGTLGSHPDGDSIITSMTLNGTNYVFGLPANEAPTVPSLTFPNDGVARKTSDTNQSKWAASTDPEGDAVSYIYQSASDAAFTHVLYDSRNVGPLTTNYIANPGEPEGVYYWHVKAIDAKGAESAWSASRSIIVDNSAPTIHYVSPVAGSAIGTTASFEFTATDTLSGVRNVNLHLMQNNVTKKIIALQQDGTSDRWFATGVTMDIPAGEYTVISRATDKAGNTQLVNTNHGKITLDKNRPTVTLVSPTASLVNGKLDVKVAATDTVRGLQTITANIYKDGTLLKSSSSSVFGTTATHAASFDLADGTYTIRYNSRNTLGNTSATGDFTVTVDNTAPIASISVSPLHNGQYVTKKVTITGAVDPSELQMKSHWFEVKGPSYYSFVSADGLNKGGNSYSVDWNTAGLPSGTYTIRYVATDAAGNRSDDPHYQNSTTLKVIVDNQGPQAHFTSTIPTYVNGNFMVAGAGSDNIGLQGIGFDIRDASSWVAGCVAGTNVLVYTNDNKNASLSCTMNTTKLVDGNTYTLRIHANDNVNYGGGESRQIVFDTTAPTATVKATSTGSNGIYSNVSFKLHDTGQIDKVTLNGTEKDLTNNAWSDLNGVKPGTFGAIEGVNTLVVFDAAGNTTTITFVLDTKAPAAPELTLTTPDGDALTDGSTTSSLGVVASWTALADTVSYVYSYWNDIATSEYDSTKPYTVPVSGTSRSGEFNQGEGTHYMQVFAVDAAGNVSAGSNVVAVTYDVTGPSIAFPSYARTDNVITPTVTNDDPSAKFKWTSAVTNPAGATISNDTALNPAFTVTASGDYAFVLTATDAAGNKTMKTFSFTYTAPVVDDQEVAATGGPNDNDPALPSARGPFTNVLGDSTEIPESETQGTPGVEGASTVKNLAEAVNNTDGKAFGLAWYWWLLILAGIATFLWWIIAAVRRRQAADA